MNKDARIRVSLTFTKNIGNYESVKIEAGLDIPTDNPANTALGGFGSNRGNFTIEDINEQYEAVYALLEDVILRESIGVADRLRGVGVTDDYLNNYKSPAGIHIDLKAKPQPEPLKKISPFKLK